MSVASADRAVRASVYRTGRLIDLHTPEGRATSQRLLKLLTDADRILAARLVVEAQQQGGEDARFTGASAIAYRRQIGTVVQLVQGRLNGLTASQARTAIDESMAETIGLLETLETRFTGIARPLRIRQAETMARASEQTRATLLRQHATSVDRYGGSMIRQFETTIATGLVGGMSQREMVASLTGHGGPTGDVSMAAVALPNGQVVRVRVENIPEGLFKRYRFWAERIVRTETANAYSAARMDGLFAARTSDFPDLKKKILAVFDNRTAPDSLGVHGQVRELEGFFQDGAGRVYQRPPARPNDRETVIPWRDHWPDTASTAPLTKSEQHEESKALGSLYPAPVPRAHEVAQEHAAAKQIAQQAEHDALAAKAQADANAAAAAAAEKAPAVVVDEKAAAKAAAKAAKLAAKAEARAAAKLAKQAAKESAAIAKQQAKQLAKSEKAIAKQAAKEAAAAAKQQAKIAAKEAKAAAKIAAKQAKLEAKKLAPIQAQADKIEAHLSTMQPLVHEGDLEAFVLNADPQSKKAIALLLKKHADQSFTQGQSLEQIVEALEVNPYYLKKTVQKLQGKPLADKPAPAPVAPPAPPPAPKAASYSPTTHTLKESGGYVDVFDAAGTKVAYFKHVGAEYVVSPPDKLTNLPGFGHFTTKTFPDEHSAAGYAVEVGKAIKSTASAAEKAAAAQKVQVEAGRASKEVHVGKPVSTHGPMPFEPEARADIDARMARLRKTLGTNGSKAIDEHMLEHQKKAATSSADYPLSNWINKWVGSSGGAVNEIAALIVSGKPDVSLAVRVLEQLRKYHGSPMQTTEEAARRFIDVLRERYAATQVALERRGVVEQVLYRGIHSEQRDKVSAAVRAAIASGATTVPFDLRSAASFAHRRGSSSGFGGVMQTRIHVSRVLISDDTSGRFADMGEAEWVVLTPELETTLHVQDWLGD